MARDTHARWLRSPGESEIRSAAPRALRPRRGLRSHRHSGVIRGTDNPVFQGGVPASQYAAMRAPFQGCHLITDSGE